MSKPYISPNSNKIVFPKNLIKECCENGEYKLNKIHKTYTKMKQLEKHM